MRYSCRNCGSGVYLEKIAHRLKCPKCRRVVPLDKRGVPVTVSKSRVRSRPRPHSLRSVDSVRFRTGGFGIGSAQGTERETTWTTPVRKSEKRIPRQSVGRFPLEPDFDVFRNHKSYQIIVTLPYHKDLDDVGCEIVNNALIVKSLLDGFDFFKKFLLPEDVDVSTLQTFFKNGIFTFYLRKTKQERQIESK